MRVWAVLRIPAELRFVTPILSHFQSDDVIVSFAVPDGVSERAICERLSAVPQARVEPLALDDHRPILAWYGRRVLPAVRELRSYVAQSDGWPSSLRRRWLLYMSRPGASVIRGAERFGLRGRRVVVNRGVGAVLAAAERAYPVPSELDRQLARLAPDVVVATPLLYPLSRDVDAVKAARRAGVPVAGIVLSWDNLSSKGTFHALPDRLLVWNETQREELTRYHRVNASLADVVGAPVFDYLFDRSWLLDRREWLARLDLPPTGRYVLFAASSAFGADDAVEIDAVGRLAAEIRGRWYRERPPKIVVRPHPKHNLRWEALQGDAVHVWRRAGFPDTAEARSDFANTVAHADAVVGINTSVFIEAAILDRPCVSLLGLGSRGRFAHVDLAHFDHLVRAGFLHLAGDERDAAATLAAVAEGEDPLRDRRRAFVRDFVRPAGTERPAGAVAAAALRRLANADG